MFKLPELPYAYDALQPTMSAETLRFHHDKHHAAYINNMNAICEQEGLKPSSLEDLVVQARQAGKTKLFNNAAQAWNHTFFWSCMTPKAKAPEGELAAAIDQAFGGLAGLKEKFVAEGVGHFGSGWVWLVAGPQGLSVRSTHDGENPLGEAGVTPILTCDLWEHAYYVDFRNDRKSFLEKWFDTLADWSLAAGQLKAAKGGGAGWRHPAPEGVAA